MFYVTLIAVGKKCNNQLGQFAYLFGPLLIHFIANYYKFP